MPTATVINKHVVIKTDPEPRHDLSVIHGVVWATDNRITCPVHRGQAVIFDKHAGSAIDLGGEKLQVVKEEDLMIILHSSEAEVAQATAKREVEAAVEAIDNSEEDCS